MPLQSKKTANQIINLALNRAGNPTITADAQVELQLIINRLNEDFWWPHLHTTITGSVTPGQATVSLPADYIDVWNKYGIRLTDVNGNVRTLVLKSEEFRLRTALDTVSGTPEFAVIDDSLQIWRPLPVPEQAYTYQLVYRRLPAQISNFDAVVDFPNDALLVQLLFVWALQREDDARFAEQMIVADNMLKRFIRRYNASPNKSALSGLASTSFAPIGPVR